MKMLTFDEATHRYALDGYAIPGVSEILQALGIVDMSNVPEDLLAYKAELGTAVHEATELDDKKRLDESSLDMAICAYLAAYRAFKWENSYIAIKTEIAAHNGDFCGRVDRVCTINGDVWVLDIKTGGVYRSVRLQTAAYFILMEKYKPVKRGALYLKDNGTYCLKEHKENDDINIWKKCVELFHWTKPRYTKKKMDFEKPEETAIGKYGQSYCFD